MLEWLKTILGEGYTEDIDRRVSAEIGKGFVAKTDFNTLKGEKAAAERALSEANGKLQALEGAGSDAETLRGEITRLKGELKSAQDTHAAELQSLRMDGAVSSALRGAKAKNEKAVRALLELEGAELCDDGSVKGLSEQLEALKKEHGYLFEGGEDTGMAHGGAGGAEDSFLSAVRAGAGLEKSE